MNANHADPSRMEVKVLGGVLIPDRSEDRTQVRVLVRRLREKIHGSAESRDEVKAGQLSDEDREFVRLNLSPDWMIATRYHVVNAARIAALKPILLEFCDGCLLELRPHLRSLGLDVGPLEDQYRTEIEGNPVYVWLLQEMYRQTAEWGKSLGIRPTLTVYLDQKIHPSKRALVEFLGRMFLVREFPGACRGERLLGLFGEDSRDFSCRVASDSTIDGLLLADIFANAAGMVVREMDPTRSYERLLPENDPAVRAVRAKRGQGG